MVCKRGLCKSLGNKKVKISRVKVKKVNRTKGVNRARGVRRMEVITVKNSNGVIVEMRQIISKYITPENETLLEQEFEKYFQQRRKRQKRG